MFNPMGMDRSFDQPYHYERNLPAFTWVLVFLGLRPYRLIRADNGQRQVVWAKSEEGVRYYAPGKVERIGLERGSLVQLTDVLVLPEEDGGSINVGGTRIT